LEQALLEALGRALEHAGVWSKGLTAEQRARIRTTPTSSGEALLSYVHARALMDRYDVPADVDAAIDLLKRCVASDPRFVLAQAALGDALWEKYASTKDPALATEATEAVMRATRADPVQAAVSYSLGNMAYQRGRLEDAANSIRRSLALQPDLDDAHRVLGHVLSDRGDVEGAIAEHRLAIRIRPSYWRHYNSLGLVYYRAGRYRDALDPYRRATELQPSAAGPFQMLGTIYYRLEQFDEAIGNYEHAVRLGPNAAAFANLALGYYARQRYDEAQQAYQRSLALNPKSIGNQRNLGDVYMRLKQPVRAKAAYEQGIAVGNELLAVNPRDYRTIALVALCEVKVGRAADAERHAAEARALAPTDREILQRSAEIHARLGDQAAALRYLKSAIDRGYGRHEALENDELAALRKLPAFVALVTDRADSKTR
jgi:tetratricopeptide (TPR) repeat protein